MDTIIGEIRWFGFNFAPRGWEPCNGQLIAISQNSALFSLLGTVYGGDGRTTFGLPDLRGRYTMSAGQGPGLSPHPLGARAGTETTRLTLLNLPNHTHPAMLSGLGTTEPGNTSDPSGALLAESGDFDSEYNNNPEVAKVPMDQEVKIGATGGEQPFSNMPPYLVMNACIAVTGIYPSRS